MNMHSLIAGIRGRAEHLYHAVHPSAGYRAYEQHLRDVEENWERVTRPAELSGPTADPKRPEVRPARRSLQPRTGLDG